MAKKDISSSKPFHFKQFSVFHHNSTMKVGTDAILLAAWCNIDKALKVLDIGTGSGVIALLLATRCNAIIDAIEPDKESSVEATLNFNNSIYNNRLNQFNTDFSNFASESDQKYDMIVSNPPYFSGDLLPNNPSRKAARHIDDLTHEKLCEGADNLLDVNGRFCLVIPTKASSEFIEIASVYNLYLHKQQLVFPKPNTKHNRVNMEFRFGHPSVVKSENITIRNENGYHTEEYRNYVSDYLISI